MKINKPKYISFYVDSNFEFILSQIYLCYQKMMTDYTEIENNENKIKNRLYKDYLNNQIIRDELGLSNFLFKTETAIINSEYDEEGYTDIEVINLKESFTSTTANYTIECKRLDSTSTLNKKYLNQGINRFIEEKYPTNYKVNGMIGFIVRRMNISENSVKLKLTPHNFISEFDFSYKSHHITKTSKKRFTLYHLMFDFSSKIKNE